jgi:hypothetical protein
MRCGVSPKGVISFGFSAGAAAGAVSYDAWRRAHGFSDQDAPTPTEVTLRLLQERGAITPELTEAMLGAIAPDIMNAVRTAQQTSSVAPIPTAVQDILKQATGEVTPPAEPEAEPEAEAEPEQAPTNE